MGVCCSQDDRLMKTELKPMEINLEQLITNQQHQMQNDNLDNAFY